MTDSATRSGRQAVEQTTHETVEGVIDCPLCVYDGAENNSKSDGERQ